MTSHPGRLVRCADAGGVARETAALFVARAHRAIAERGRFTVALAGGSTPKAAYERLAGDLRAALDWREVLFFFGDERCVPPDDDRSNYRMACETLFEPLGIDEAAIFRMRGEIEPQIAATDYEAVLARELGDRGFDLVLLGMGPDGHTASLFPGMIPADDRDVDAVHVEKLAMDRITLTPRAINRAASVAIAVSGAEKSPALARVLGGPLVPMELPIQRIDPIGGDLIWIADASALAGLPAPGAELQAET